MATQTIQCMKKKPVGWPPFRSFESIQPNNTVYRGIRDVKDGICRNNFHSIKMSTLSFVPLLKHGHALWIMFQTLFFPVLMFIKMFHFDIKMASHKYKCQLWRKKQDTDPTSLLG